MRTDDRIAVVRITASVAVSAKGRDLVESPVMTGPWGAESFFSIARLSLPEAAARLELVERDLSAKLGGKLESTVFQKTPSTTVAEFLGRFEGAPWSGR